MKRIAWLILVMMEPLVSFAKPPADIQLRLDEWIKDQPGGVAVAWVDQDGTAFFQAGHFDGPDSPQITPDTQFEVGSITKVFTSLLLAESERLGKVSRTDPAAKFLLPPGDPDLAKLDGITLVSLATHTSGLPRLSSNIGRNPDANPDPYAKFDHAMLLDALRHDGAVARPGGDVAYSNFGVAVLGEALGAAWNTSYAEALREHVLEPLDLKATTLGLAGSPAPRDFPPSHSNGKTVPTWTFQAYAPCGALRSSARDMAHFLTIGLGLEKNPLSESIQTTLQPLHPTQEFAGQIGLAWFIADDGIVWHNGATAGSHGLLAFDPKKKVGVVVLANVQASAESLGFGLLGAKPLKPKVEIVADASSYVGRYPLAPTFAIDVTENHGSLQVQATAQPPFRLREIAKDRFALIGVPAEISFERGPDGKVTALVLHQNGRDQRAPRNDLPPPPKTVALPLETLREYVGQYPLAPQFIITITEESGALFAQATGQPKFPLFASARDEFFYKVVNAQLSFQRDAAGQVTGLVLHQNGRDQPAPRAK